MHEHRSTHSVLSAESQTNMPGITVRFAFRTLRLFNAARFAKLAGQELMSVSLMSLEFIFFFSRCQGKWHSSEVKESHRAVSSARFPMCKGRVWSGFEPADSDRSDGMETMQLGRDENRFFPMSSVWRFPDSERESGRVDSRLSAR